MYLDEEPAYDALVHIMFGSNLRELYKPSMEGVVKRLDQLNRLLGRRIPQLKTHLENLGVAPLLYASSWFLTLFATGWVHCAQRPKFHRHNKKNQVPDITVIMLAVQACRVPIALCPACS